MADFDPLFEIEAQALSGVIDELDYFQVLKIEQNTPPPKIKDAYFRESRLYHPDQFFAMPNGETKSAVAKIYKRINEAWVVLRDERKRTKYLQDINGPERGKKLRFTEASEEELKKQREQELGTTPHGRKTFQQGLLDLDAGRFAQAASNFKMALTFEPQNALFKAKLEEATRLAAGKK